MNNEDGRRPTPHVAMLVTRFQKLKLAHNPALSLPFCSGKICCCNFCCSTIKWLRLIQWTLKFRRIIRKRDLLLLRYFFSFVFVFLFCFIIALYLIDCPSICIFIKKCCARQIVRFKLLKGRFLMFLSGESQIAPQTQLKKAQIIILLN